MADAMNDKIEQPEETIATLARQDERQRTITERLLIGALREQDTAREATETSRRAIYLASASHELAKSLDRDATREVIQRRALPRDGSWCIVDIVELDGSTNRLPVLHPDPSKQALARSLADHWFPKTPQWGTATAAHASAKPRVIMPDAEAALISAAHGSKNLAVLRDLGFGGLLVVPLVIRGVVLGAITFVTQEGDAPFLPEEITLASDLADVCAMALDNARLYREAEVLRAAADVANDAKSAFLGNMSHELRTPLNAIGGYAELLEMGIRGPVNAEQRADLVRIKQNQQHLLALINDILDYVHSESGRLEYHYGKVPIQPALNAVSEMLSGAAKARGLVIEVRGADANPVVWADPDRIRQILMNLVMNAVKYTPAGGGLITVGFRVTPDGVLIDVADCGPGIPADKLAAIFEPFVQLESGTTNRQGGVGLGLAISRDLARAMSGDLTVYSLLGVGSCFTLRLPRARRDSSPG
jgi:signal transduction histidine kinase